MTTLFFRLPMFALIAFGMTLLGAPLWAALPIAAFFVGVAT